MASDAEADRPTVLVVEDEPEAADLYTKQLRDSYHVLTAYSGEEALDLLDSTVDIVLLDRRMPGLSGDEVLEEIRSRGINCRVIMVTAIDPDLEIIDLPFDEYLTKPVTGQELQDTIKRMLGRADHDAKMQNFMQVASKMATLESKMRIDEIEASEEYAALEERFTELREELEGGDEVDDLYAEFTTEKLRSLVD